MAASNSPKVKALILTFEYHDVDGLTKETRDVRYVFESLWGDDMVTKTRIPMQDSLKVLKEQLDEFLPRKNTDTLFIIYYHGHGFKNRRHQLSLRRSVTYPSLHNRSKCWSIFMLKYSDNSHNYPRDLDKKLAAFWNDVQNASVSRGQLKERL